MFPEEGDVNVVVDEDAIIGDGVDTILDDKLLLPAETDESVSLPEVVIDDNKVSITRD